MKLKIVLRRLAIRSLIIFGILGALGGFTLYIADVNDDYLKQAASLQSQTDGIVRDINQLRERYSQSDKYTELYADIQKKIAGGSLKIGNTALRDVFTGLRTKNYFHDLKINMVVNKPLDDAKYKRSTMYVESADVTIDAQTTSDENVFDVISELNRLLSGIKVTHMDMSLIKPLDAAALQEISQKGGSPLVKTNLKFTWYGIKSTADDAADTATPAAAGGVAPMSAPGLTNPAAGR